MPATQGPISTRTIIERFGANAGMPEALSRITNYERSGQLSVDGCKAVYLELREAFEHSR